VVVFSNPDARIFQTLKKSAMHMVYFELFSYKRKGGKLAFFILELSRQHDAQGNSLALRLFVL